MTILTLILTVILIVFFERLLGSFLSFQNSLPTIVPALVLYYAINRNLTLALFSAIMAGWFVDSISGLPWGASSISLMLVVIIVRIYRDIAFERLWLEQSMLGALSGACFILFQFLLIRHNSELPLQISLSALIMKMFFSSLCCGIAAPLVCSVMKLVEHLLGNISIKEELNAENVRK